MAGILGDPPRKGALGLMGLMQSNPMWQPQTGGGLLSGNWQPNPGDLRSDGKPKGRGWLGVLQRPDGGVSTELSVGVNLGGNETEIPLLVPTLSPDEVKYLLSSEMRGPIPRSILGKAVEHAKARIAAGLSPYKE